MAKLKVREIAETQGLKLADLQIQAKMPMSTLRRYWYCTTDGSQHGKELRSINLDTLEVIAGVLGVGLTDLISEADLRALCLV